MSTLLMINVLMSMIFIMMTHPLSMGLNLLIQTIMISLITGNLILNFWFSYIIFLILIGGLLILFMYMTSIASNEKFKFNMKMLWFIPITPFILMMNNFLIDLSIINNETLKFNFNNSISQTANKFINLPTNLILLLMVVYLLITLIATVKITDFKQGPLRQMN